MNDGRGRRPNPSKVFNVPSASEEEDEADDEVLAVIIRNKQERVTQAKGSAIPLMMDPKLILDFIDLWYDNPQTPIDDLKLPPRPSHMLTTFINEEIWKAQKAKQARKAKTQKESFLKNNILTMTPNQLLTAQTEIKKLSEEYNRFNAELKGTKVRFVNVANKVITEHNKQVAANMQPQNPQANYIVELPDDSDDKVPPTNEPITGAEEMVASEELVTASTTASATPKENAPSPKSSEVNKVKLPFTLEVKKTKAPKKEAANQQVLQPFTTILKNMPSSRPNCRKLHTCS
ncbi:hypothetical protein ZWY2020_033365 [Hordeum vulgare]|nr:hypothetical protein ZWY2020_033365 [Hordeum vulgare]